MMACVWQRAGTRMTLQQRGRLNKHLDGLQKSLAVQKGGKMKALMIRTLVKNQQQKELRSKSGRDLEPTDSITDAVELMPKKKQSVETAPPRPASPRAVSPLPDTGVADTIRSGNTEAGASCDLPIICCAFSLFGCCRYRCCRRCRCRRCRCRRCRRRCRRCRRCRRRRRRRRRCCCCCWCCCCCCCC
jgi:hypothetical protein